MPDSEQMDDGDADYVEEPTTEAPAINTKNAPPAGEPEEPETPAEPKEEEPAAGSDNDDADKGESSTDSDTEPASLDSPDETPAEEEGKPESVPDDWNNPGTRSLHLSHNTHSTRLCWWTF